MPERWLQIRGDPSGRAFLFEQQRIESLFDTSIEHLHQIVLALLTRKGVLHAKIHYLSSQLICWFARDPFCHEKFVRAPVAGQLSCNRGNASIRGQAHTGPKCTAYIDKVARAYVEPTQRPTSIDAAA
ncbi:MAG: hypothetical protein ACWGOW_09745 [Gammaproteobacteria bacterium]